MGKSSTVITILVVMALISAVGVGFMIYDSKTQQTAIQTGQQQVSSGAGLTGKPATLSVNGLDGANDNAALASRLFLITDPVVGGDSITGKFAADGQTLSTTARTDVTSGLVVGSKYLALASNNTYFGFPSEVKTIQDKQTDLVDVVSYTQANNGQQGISIKDKNEDPIGASGATANVTMSSDETQTLDEVKIEINASNVATNIAGFYFDKSTNSNISRIEKPSGYSGSPSFDKASLNLERTEADDVVFLFSAPILLKEYDSITLKDALSITMDGDFGTASETLTLYTLDKIWTKSSKYNDKMIYAYETDGSTPADVGMTDDSFAFVIA